MLTPRTPNADLVAANTSPQYAMKVVAIISLGTFPVIFGSLFFLNALSYANSNLGALLVTWFSGLCVVAGFRVLWKLFCDIGTRITEKSISRPTLTGRQSIAWSDVTEFAVAANAVCGIYAKNGGMVMPLYLYVDPPAVVTLIASKVMLDSPRARVSANITVKNRSQKSRASLATQ